VIQKSLLKFIDPQGENVIQFLQRTLADSIKYGTSNGA